MNNNKSNEETICLIACAANEKLYIKDWVEYYLNTVKVDKIIIIDNNFSNNERLQSILKSYNKVSVISKYRNKHIVQKKIYTEMYKRFSNAYDWIMFFDIDEFLVMNNKKQLKEWLTDIDKDIDEIFVNWKIFDDNDLVKYDKRPVMKRFTREYIEDKNSEEHPEYFKVIKGKYYYIRNNFQVKSIIRGKGSNKRYIKSNVHKSEFKNGKYVDSDLKSVKLDNPNLYMIDHITYKNCQLNHYIQKTIDEYIDRARLYAIKEYKVYRKIDEIRRNFQRFNKWTDEKEKILQNKFKKKK